MSSKASVSGLILLDKPAGVTSCNALFPLRKIFKTRRVGHAGSLDMRASGLIVAAVGRATRLLPFVEAGEKHLQRTLAIPQKRMNGTALSLQKIRKQLRFPKKKCKKFCRSSSVKLTKFRPIIAR